MKRIKSFGMIIGSILFVAFLAALSSSEAVSAAMFVKDWLLLHGWNPVWISLLGVFVSQFWMGFVNWIKLRKAADQGNLGGAGVDLY